MKVRRKARDIRAWQFVIPDVTVAMRSEMVPNWVLRALLGGVLKATRVGGEARLALPSGEEIKPGDWVTIDEDGLEFWVAEAFAVEFEVDTEPDPAPAP